VYPTLHGPNQLPLHNNYQNNQSTPKEALWGQQTSRPVRLGKHLLSKPLLRPGFIFHPLSIVLHDFYSRTCDPMMFLVATAAQGLLECGRMVKRVMKEYGELIGVKWEIGSAYERLYESKRGCLSLWKIGWVCQKLSNSVRGWVSLWGIGWVFEKLSTSVRGSERLGESERGWVSL
jgi:hypothetical protein